MFFAIILGAALLFYFNYSKLKKMAAKAVPVEIENKLFGRFNTLSDRADLWAGIEKPKLESLDQNLKKLYPERSSKKVTWI